MVETVDIPATNDANSSGNGTSNDMLNPYFAYPNENPSAAIVSPPLNGGNYHYWSHAMLLVLKTITKCDFLMALWLHHSLEPEILQSIMMIENASDIWNALKK